MVLALCALLLFFHRYSVSHVVPHTYIGPIAVGGMDTEQALAVLAREYQKPINIVVKGRVYQYRLEESGVLMNYAATIARIFEPSRRAFPRNLIAYGDALRSQRMTLPVFTFTDRFKARFEASTYDFTTQPDEVRVDARTAQLSYISNTEAYRMHLPSLQSQLVAHFGYTRSIEPQLTRIPLAEPPQTVKDLNTRLSRVTEKSADLVIDSAGVKSYVSVEPSTLKDALIINYDMQQSSLAIGINETVATTLAASSEKRLAAQLHEQMLDEESLRQSLLKLAMNRFNGGNDSYILVALKDKPNTNGAYAQKYIEIDISQQRLYQWERNGLIASRRVSTGLYYPTPPGQYRILNKATNTYSYIYHVWMPYWMAFSLDPKVNAYLGIHELPYWVDPFGQEIRRPRDFIGSPHTGGCVSLDIGEAQQVYAWAEVGTPVVIYD